LDRSQLLIALPAFNEEKTIANIIISILSEYNCRVLVVDDGSHDKTALISKKSGATVISHPHNLGYESALNTAYLYADDRNFKKIIFFDADGEHPIDELANIDSLLNETLCIVGNRSKKNRIAESIASLYCKYSNGFFDPYCGLKGYNISRINALSLHVSPGDKIGTSAAINLARTSKKFVRNLDIKTQKRNGYSRFSSSLIKSNILLLKNIFTE